MPKITRAILESNLWKYLLFDVTQRRSFWPILSIYFLTLPDTAANQIGIYTGIGSIASFLFEIPSGYFSDQFGHKKTLILSKLCMIVSTLSFIFAQSLFEYVIGSVFLSLAFAFQSGTSSAFLHDTLASIGREKEYAKISSQQSANVSIISMVFLITLPFLTPYDIRLPFFVGLVMEIIGLFLALSFTTPPKEKEHRANKSHSILELLHEAKSAGLLPFSIFTGIMGGILIASSGFREVYLLEIGFPLVLIGTVMGLSRLVWFIVGHHIHWLEKIPLSKILFAEMFLFPGAVILIALWPNPYAVGLVFTVLIGYYWGRAKLLEHYFIEKYIRKPKYKATLLSIDTQIQLLVQIGAAFLLSHLMKDTLQSGFLAIGVIFFILSAAAYPFLKKRLKEDANGSGIDDHHTFTAAPSVMPK